MSKRSNSPSHPSSLHASSSMFKNPVFWLLVGLSGILMLTSMVLYTRLETLSQQDDDLLTLGSSAGDGIRNDAIDLRLRQRHHHSHNKQNHDRHGGRGGDAAGDDEPHKKRTASRKAKGNQKSGLFGAMGRGPPNMPDMIAGFVQWKKDDAQKRQKYGLLTMRQEFEKTQGYGSKSLREEIQSLRVPDPPTSPGLPYDIHNCPDQPPAGYPYAWNVLKVLDNWNPDDTDIPAQIHQGLCIFDWDTDQHKAYSYRTAQVPFVLQNYPEIAKASLRWTHEGYLDRLLGNEPVRNEHSLNNHFMYWKTRHPLPDFKPPTDMVSLTFHEWYQRALDLQNNSQLNSVPQTQQEHWYFRLNALMDKHGHVYEELPFFDPSLGESMTMIDPYQHRGINCRFGMKGVTAETHFDSSSNFITLMGGQRRYILAHPDQCVNMELYPQDHPSGRHSSINWSSASRELANTDRPFVHALVNEVVLQAGDALYLPTYWFHFIVSLNLNYQCNSRSGEFYDYEPLMTKCGFEPPSRRRQRM